MKLMGKLLHKKNCFKNFSSCVKASSVALIIFKNKIIFQKVLIFWSKIFFIYKYLSCFLLISAFFGTVQYSHSLNIVLYQKMQK